MKENNNSKKEMFINKLSLQITSKILNDIYWGIQYSNLNFLYTTNSQPFITIQERIENICR